MTVISVLTSTPNLRTDTKIYSIHLAIPYILEKAIPFSLALRFSTDQMVNTAG